MIELKDVSTQQRAQERALNGCSLVLRNGDIHRFDRQQGELIINVILGFCPITEGFVSYDGMPLNERSVAFLRKMTAYIPTPDDFHNVDDPAAKQRAMLTEALQSDANIILAVDPFSYLDATTTRVMLAAFQQKAQQGAVIVIATDNPNLL